MSTPTPGVTGELDEGTPATPAAASGANDKPDFQKAIDAVVARERKAAEAREAALKAKIDELETRVPKPAPKADIDPAYLDSVRKPLFDENAALKAELDTLTGSLLKADLVGVVKPLAADGAESDILDALLPRVKRTATGVEVLDAEGRPRYGKTGPMTVQELALELAASKPFLFAPKVRSGLGGGGTPATAAGGKTLDSIKAEIADAEAKQEFGKAARLKSEWLDLKNRRK